MTCTCPKKPDEPRRPGVATLDVRDLVAHLCREADGGATHVRISTVLLMLGWPGPVTR